MLSWHESVFVDSKQSETWDPGRWVGAKASFCCGDFYRVWLPDNYEVENRVESLWVGESNKSFLDEARKLEDRIFDGRVKKSKSYATFIWCMVQIHTTIVVQINLTRRISLKVPLSWQWPAEVDTNLLLRNSASIRVSNNSYK